MSATSTVGMESGGRAGSMSLKVSGDYGDYMEVVWFSDLNQVSELTVGGAFGPWYVARNILMVSDSVPTDQRILAAAKHFQRLVGEPCLTQNQARAMWDIFRAIWDYFEIDAPIA
jgi:hypothetical protein